MRSFVLASLALLVPFLSVAGAAPPPVRCATTFMRESLPAIAPADYLRAREAARPAAGLPPPAYQVGESREFWAWVMEVQPPGFRRVTATCRAVSDHTYLFVEDALVEQGKVDDEDVRRLDGALHRATPMYSVDPRKGIVELEVGNLGTPPDTLDGDPRVYFLVLKIDEYHGIGFDGYFNAFDQLPEDVAWEQYQQHSNEIEVLYLNGDRGDISGAYMLGVMAHELAHLIAHAYDGEELPWLSESLGEAAMQLCGYFTDQKHVQRYAAHPEKPLVSDGYANYGAGFLFAAYLRGLTDPGVWGALLRDPGRGQLSVEGVLAAHGHEVAFLDLYARFAAANLFAGQGRRVHAYRHPGVVVPPFQVAGHLVSGSAHEGQLAPWGYHFLELPPGGFTVHAEGPVALFELLPGRSPRALEVAGDSLETLDEPRWLLVLGTEGEDRSFRVDAE